MHDRVQRNVPLAGLGVLRLGPEDLEPLPSDLPLVLPILLHRVHDPFLLTIVHAIEATRQRVDVEHDEVGRQGDGDDDVDECRRAELVVHAPQGCREGEGQEEDGDEGEELDVLAQPGGRPALDHS